MSGLFARYWGTLFLVIALVSVTAFATVTYITWTRSFTFTLTLPSVATASDYRAYSDSSCTTPISTGGSENLGSFASGSQIYKNIWVKGPADVGGTVHYSFIPVLPPYANSFGVAHLHSGEVLHSLEAHPINPAECLPVRIYVNTLPGNEGPKSISISLGRV